MLSKVFASPGWLFRSSLTKNVDLIGFALTTIIVLSTQQIDLLAASCGSDSKTRGKKIRSVQRAGQTSSSSSFR